MLGDAETMRWYPRPYSGDEVRMWIERQMARYPEGNGLLGLVEKADRQADWGLRSSVAGG